MESFAIYLIKVNVALIVLYTFYKLSFSKDTFFRLRRMMLLLICATSFVYPFIDFPVWADWGNHPVGETLAVVYAKILPEVSVHAFSTFSGAENIRWTVDTYLWMIYGIGIALLILRTTFEMFKMYTLLLRSSHCFLNGTYVYQSVEIDEPYSFFHWIFINPARHSDKEISEILIHERTHMREFHSLDILLAQLIIILCWFNPFAWLIRSEIRMNHEYLVDKQVITLGHDKKSYQYHLLGMEHSSLAAANIYNNFSVLPLKKRIKMLNKKRTSNIMLSKYLMFIPVVALLVLFSNCANKAESGASTGEVKKDSSAVVKIDDRNHDTKEMAEMSKAKADEVKNDFTIHDIVENMPVFPGGQSALLAYLGENIEYPTNAKENGAQGRVIVEFVVGKDGSISEAKIARSVDPYLDKEALRVINKMPKWEPGTNKGKPVNVKFTVPVIFRLR